MPKYHPKIMDAARELKWNPHDQWNVEKIAEVINQCVTEVIIEQKSTILKTIADQFSKYVETSPNILCGTLVLKGTRFPLAKVFSELANGHNLNGIAIEYNFDRKCLWPFFHKIAAYLSEVEGDKS